MVGVETIHNNVKKPSGTLDAWNAGATHFNGLTADGYVEFTTGENTTAKIAGLGPGSTDPGYADIPFAIGLQGNGNVGIFENGVRQGTVSTYVAGDRFRIQVRDGVVSYWRNGIHLRDSAQTPVFPLNVEVSLKTPGATIEDVTMDSLVFWTTVVGAHAVESDLDKTDGTAAWNAGAVSIESITSDGYVEFTTGERDAAKLAGLGSGNSSARAADVEFAVHLKSNGRFAVMESGTSRGTFGTYAPGDLFRVAVDHGVVTYWRNGALFYTSQVAPTLPLLLDTSLRDPGATIIGARVVPCVSSSQSLWPVDHLVAIDAASDVLLVGNPEDSFGLTTDATDVYRRSPGGWALEQRLATGTGAGRTVATDGQTLAIAGNGLQIFRHDGTAWVREASFVDCSVGVAVAVHGDRVVVAGDMPSDFPRIGRLYVYRRTALRWRLEATLRASDGSNMDFFGSQVAMGGDRIFVGAPGNNTRGGAAGAVYVFRRNASLPDPGWASCGDTNTGKWEEETVLYSPSAQPLDWFGNAGLDVNSTGTLLVAGNSQEGDQDVPGWNGPGLVVAFRDTGAGWEQAALLTPSHGVPGSLFGSSLALGGPDPAAPDLLVVSAPIHDITKVKETYVYRLESGDWREIGRLPHPNYVFSTIRDKFAVAATADEVMVARNKLLVQVYGVCSP